MKKALLAVLSFSLAVSSLAQMPTFRETVVVTASGEAENADEAPAAVAVIDGDEMERSLEVSASALLRRVPGVTLLRSGLDGGVSSLFSRGTNSNQTLVLFEGIRLNDPYFGGFDWSLPLAAGIGRMELVRGPYSALYGSDAMGGVVQLFAPQPTEQNFQLLGEGGSGGWQRWQAQTSLARTRWDLAAAAAWRQGTGALTNDSFWGKSLTLVAHLRPSSAGQLGVLLRVHNGHTEVPFSASRLTPHRYTAAEQTLVGLPFRWRLSPALTLTGSLARVRGSLAFRDPDDPWGYTAADTRTQSWQGRAVLHGRTGAHRWQLGGEWRQEEVTASSSFGVALDRQRQEVSAGFAQDRVALGGWGELTLGARYDQAAHWRELSPRLVWQRRWRWGRLWVAAGKGFRAPTLGELYYPGSGNPQLQPERSRNLELGLALPLPAHWVVQLVPFSNRVRNLVDFDYASWRFANVARALQRGLELSAERRAGTRLWRWAATWLDAEDGQGQALLRRPRWSSSLTLGESFAAGTGEVTLVYVGRRQDLDPLGFARVWQGGFVTANLAFRYRLSQLLVASLRVENLADRSYQEVRGYPGPGRRAFLGVELSKR